MTEQRSRALSARRRGRLWLPLGAALACAHAGGAAATVVNVDEFAVTRNGGALFDDTFASTAALGGGSGTAVSSGVNFAGDGPANYFVRGTIQQNNPGATLDTTTGPVVPQSEPFIPTIQITNAFLETGSNPAGAHALTSATSLAATALFNFTVPSVVLGTYDLALSDRFVANGGAGNVLELRVRNCATGIGLCGGASGAVLQFFWGNFITNTDALIAQVTLTAAQLAAPQLELQLSKAASSDVVTAAFAFGSGTSLASFTGALATLGSTTGATDLFTPSLQAVQAGIEAFDPVPEPPALLLLLGAIALCCAFMRPSRDPTRR